ncbi:hypothetical protein COX05_01265 [candidate division WWE3 bacterium CG22_combo_CG10-13_8_21_14_all_39_12]|uniref:Transposase IS200-like domain-containing protein n=2 Tax=Katanobacteria TaxID=422282 RepID=A0A2M7X2I8_UNCKA|nr:MAG: hypothetical protein COX05_01265 [candidate division WWE3 bacterium CG22_combo_CG10-13_8_21_14_all_39_12]PJA40329.1 MAG: hypothetical protein CO179_02545 [candidate division WWE3 bacterium CG_4_9_14_3_um_filter_39_7]
MHQVIFAAATSNVDIVDLKEKNWPDLQVSTNVHVDLIEFVIIFFKVGRPFHIDTGDILHVYNRGVDKRVVFDFDNDRERFIHLLWYVNNYSYPYSKYLRQHMLSMSNPEEFITSMYQYEVPLCTIVGYVLMDNHYHLLLREDGSGGVSKFLQKLQNAYTRYYNLKNDRTGCLFQGKYKAVLVESHEQLIHVSRYIHLNPVVAGLIDIGSISNYKWSSYPTYISRKKNNSVCSPDIVLDNFRSKETFISFTCASFTSEDDTDSMRNLSIDGGL